VSLILSKWKGFTAHGDTNCPPLSTPHSWAPKTKLSCGMAWPASPACCCTLGTGAHCDGATLSQSVSGGPEPPAVDTHRGCDMPGGRGRGQRRWEMWLSLAQPPPRGPSMTPAQAGIDLGK
jgi:hypothetical protein